MFGLLAFFFSTDTTGSDSSEATVVATGLQIGTSSTICKNSHLEKLRATVLEMLGQANDGTDITEERVVGALASGSDIVVKYVRATDTITIGSQVAYSRVKATKFCEGLVAFGLVVLPA